MRGGMVVDEALVASGCEEFHLETADLKLVVRHTPAGTED